VIPRQVDFQKETWLSRLLPEVVGRYLRRRERKTVMLHTVPSLLAKNKSLVHIFERHWNRYVSPGEGIFALRGAGEQRVQQARRQGQMPSGFVHEKDVFR
jgi:hypothetical protein